METEPNSIPTKDCNHEHTETAGAPQVGDNTSHAGRLG